MSSRRYQPRASQRITVPCSRRARRPVKNDGLQDRSPPEDWHDPIGGSNYRIIEQPAGDGFRHILTAEQVRDRLSLVPQHFLEGLDVIQFSRMTMKKQRMPCYGLQWGTSLYLYPLEESLEEWFPTPQPPGIVNEAKMYGGIWDEPWPGAYRLTWTESTIVDFYLNNILIHELGHHVDKRNTNAVKRERYAEWFAIQYGYLASGGRDARKRPITRRHHSKG